MPRKTTDAELPMAPEAPAEGTAEAPKAKRERVNVGLMESAFTVVGAKPENARERKSPVGRQISDLTANALRFLRAHPGDYCKVGEWKNPGAPSDRLSWMGYFQNEDGTLREPTVEEEKSTNPNDYPVRKRIAYSYAPNPNANEGKGGFDLLLCLTNEDWTPPKKRGPRKPKENAATPNGEAEDTSEDVESTDQEEVSENSAA